MESGMSCPCFNMRWAGQARGQIFVIPKPKYWCIGWVDFGKGVERIKVFFILKRKKRIETKVWVVEIN